MFENDPRYQPLEITSAQAEVFLARVRHDAQRHDLTLHTGK